MKRFYFDSTSRAGQEILLGQDEAHHLKDVLRLGPDSVIAVFDGEGREFRCIVREVRRDGARLEILSETKTLVESPLEITLYQALAKGEKFDWIVQKATELGVYRIVPLITEHIEVKLKDESTARRLERWRRISLEAVKQSGRRRLVEIIQPIPITEALESCEAELKFFFNERGGQALKNVASAASQSAAIVIGPEGGWHDREIALAEASGFHSVSLGPRILRTETAAIVSVALVQQLFGDL